MKAQANNGMHLTRNQRGCHSQDRMLLAVTCGRVMPGVGHKPHYRP
jgi:hypothetical protein